MEAATIASRTLQIDGMTGDVCVRKVADAIKDVAGVRTESVSIGSATIVADQAGAEAACTAIAIAGFKAYDTARTKQANNSCSISEASTADRKFGNDSTMQNPRPIANPATDPDSFCSETARSIGIGPAATVPADI